MPKRRPSNCAKEVYDSVYGGAISYEQPRGAIAFLTRKLSRFGVGRNEVAYDFLPCRGGRLLDVGCGDGDFTFMAKNKFKRCYGVDVSSVRIARAKRRAKERLDGHDIAFNRCNVDEKLPFPTSFFDAVSCIAVLEHVLNPPVVLDEIHRVLGRSGILIVQVPNIAWIPCRISLLSGRLPTTGGIYLGADWEHLHNFTRSVLYQLLTREGFQIEQVSCSGIFARFRRLCIPALAGDIIVKCIRI